MTRGINEFAHSTVRSVIDRTEPPKREKTLAGVHLTSWAG